MNFNMLTYLRYKNIIDITKSVYNNTRYGRHVMHTDLVRRYALIINARLGNPISREKLETIAIAHDMLKDIEVIGHCEEKYNLPNDLQSYIDINIGILNEFGVMQSIGKPCSVHAIAAGLYMYKEVGVTDMSIIYPIMFHSCPYYNVYKDLDYSTKLTVDIIVLADKLSSNYIKVHNKNKDVNVDLELLVFGKNSKEFSFELGLLAASLLRNYNNMSNGSRPMVKHYHKRVIKRYPMFKKCTIDDMIKEFGGNRPCKKRKSQLLKIR